MSTAIARNFQIGIDPTDSNLEWPTEPKAEWAT